MGELTYMPVSKIIDFLLGGENKYLTDEEYRGFYVSPWASPEEIERVAVAEIFRFAKMCGDKHGSIK